MVAPCCSCIGVVLVPPIADALAFSDPVAGAQRVERGVSIRGERLADGIVADLVRGLSLLALLADSRKEAEAICAGQTGCEG
jgi:hypothetical protein